MKTNTYEIRNRITSNYHHTYRVNTLELTRKEASEIRKNGYHGKDDMGYEVNIRYPIVKISK